MVSLRRGLPLFEVRELKGGKVTRFAKLQKQTARIDDPVAFGSDFAALIARPTAAPAIMRIAKGGLAPLSPPPPEEIEPASSAKARCASSDAPTGKRCMRSTTRREALRTEVRQGPLRRRSFSCTAGPRP